MRFENSTFQSESSSSGCLLVCQSLVGRGLNCPACSGPFGDVRTGRQAAQQRPFLRIISGTGPATYFNRENVP